ncbi:nodulation protein NolW [Methylobacterium sp. J-076]|uniref:nodulation protein NolW n=1 Tax=Methylobacterium sp. J-076 TaxID=2836655 RepID=UPI001FB994EF|nr:nodulation protein NolW [Methylobacterium sp. J-076]MCJ2013124.1 nodulation protein NolW [Methylobacterium sp. J-076]
MTRSDRFGRGFTACAVVLGSMAVGGLGCAAAPLRLPNTVYRYTVIDQDLAAALQEFGANLNLKVSISPEVKGQIQGRMPEGSPQAFLDRLAGTYNLEWYYDGSLLSITSARETRTQLLVLGQVRYEALTGALDSLRISDPRFPVRPTPGKGVAMVSGPPRYVALVEQTLAGLAAEEQARPKPSQPREALPAKLQPLTVFRGSQTTVIRDDRPGSTVEPGADAPPRPDGAARR